MTHGDGFGKFIKQQRIARGLKLREAARLAGLSHSRLSEVERGAGYHTNSPTRPSREAVERLADAYGLPVGSLLALAGYEVTEAATLAADVREVVTLYQALGPTRRRLARAMLRTFVDDEATEGQEG